MKLYLLLLALIPLITAELPLAEPCDAERCIAPECRCSTTNIPGNLDPRDTPQFVTLTFDDAINIVNILTYRRILYGRTNSNNCPVSATFFIAHEYTNYELVNELYNQGYEIGLNSISHRTPQNWWQDATVPDLMGEIADQRIQMSYFANVPYDHIQGARMPFLQPNGNNSFTMLSNIGMLYDSTLGTQAHIAPGLWPYTLDFQSIQDCTVQPCPTASIPGVWVKPLISWFDESSFPCVTLSGCFHTPEFTDEDGWFHFIVRNFERHYFSNRAPFNLNLDEGLIGAHPAVERALIRFLDMLNSLQDVYMVRESELIEWTKDPVPVNEYNERPCARVEPRICFSSICGPLTSTHNDVEYYMGVCTPCPAVYPWVGNPLGLLQTPNP